MTAPRKASRRLSAIVIAGIVIGGMFGGDFLRLLYSGLGWPWPGK